MPRKVAEKDRKSTTIGFRLSQGLRDQLEAARMRDGTPERTLSQEIEARLRASFGVDEIELPDDLRRAVLKVTREYYSRQSSRRASHKRAPREKQ